MPAYTGLTTLTGFDGLARYVISDADYAELRQDLPENMIVKNILFNVEDLDASYAFARELYKQYCSRASEDMLKLTGYDEHQEEIALAEDGYYGYADPVTPNPEHSEEYCDWKYTPSFKILSINNGFISFGIFYMLFVYVAVICLAAVAVISYTRCMTVAVKNKQVFMLWQNDGRFTQAEMRIVFVEAALCAVIALFQYVVYRISMRQAKKAVSADEGV